MTNLNTDSTVSNIWDTVITLPLHCLKIAFDQFFFSLQEFYEILLHAFMHLFLNNYAINRVAVVMK